MACARGGHGGATSETCCLDLHCLQQKTFFRIWQFGCIVRIIAMGNPQCECNTRLFPCSASNCSNYPLARNVKLAMEVQITDCHNEFLVLISTMICMAKALASASSLMWVTRRKEGKGTWLFVSREMGKG